MPIIFPGRVNTRILADNLASEFNSAEWPYFERRVGFFFIVTGLPNPIFIAVLTMIWGLVPSEMHPEAVSKFEKEG